MDRISKFKLKSLFELFAYFDVIINNFWNLYALQLWAKHLNSKFIDINIK
jgi:hypothetical protein